MADLHRPEVEIVSRNLGWGNRKAGLEAYGPGGRWSKRADGTPVSTPNGGDPIHGDLLGDALDRAGFSEGATLLVVAINRGPDHDAHLAAVLAGLNLLFSPEQFIDP